MVSAADSLPAKILALARTHGPKALLEVVLNFALPFAIYSLTRDRFGDVPALMMASGPPVLWSISGFIRERKIDAISILVLSGIVLSLLAYAGGGGVKMLQLREHLVTGLVGLIFLGSIAVGRPLLYHLARAGAARRSADAAALLSALRDDTRFQRQMLVATVVWGIGLVGNCAVQCALVFILTIKQFLLVSGPVGYTWLGLLTAWTFWFVPRAVRQAMARRGI
jgi:hypothetical protein